MKTSTKLIAITVSGLFLTACGPKEDKTTAPATDAAQTTEQTTTGQAAPAAEQTATGQAPADDKAKTE